MLMIMMLLILLLLLLLLMAMLLRKRKRMMDLTTMMTMNKDDDDDNNKKKTETVNGGEKRIVSRRLKAEAAVTSVVRKKGGSEDFSTNYVDTYHYPYNSYHPTTNINANDEKRSGSGNAYLRGGEDGGVDEGVNGAGSVDAGDAVRVPDQAVGARQDLNLQYQE